MKCIRKINILLLIEKVKDYTDENILHIIDIRKYISIIKTISSLEYLAFANVVTGTKWNFSTILGHIYMTYLLKYKNIKKLIFI